MKIKIGKYFIKGCRDGYEIYQEKPTRDHEGVLVGGMSKYDVRWYCDLGQACNRLLTILPANSDAVSIRDLKTLLKEAKDEITRVVKETLDE